MLAANFGRHHHKSTWHAWGPFPRSVWIHPNTPKDDLDRICFKIWTRIQTSRQDLGSGLPEKINVPCDIIADCQTVPLNKTSCDRNSNTEASPSTEGTKITIPGRHKDELGSEQNIKQRSEEFKSLSRGDNIPTKGPEVHKDLFCHAEDPHDSKHDGTSTEQSQQRNAGNLMKRVLCQKDPWLPVVEEYPPLPCPAQPWKGRVCQRSAAPWPSPPAPSNTGEAQNVKKEIQDFLRNVLLKPGQDIPPNRQAFLQDQPISKGTKQTEIHQLHLKRDIAEPETRPCQTRTGTNHDLNADCLCVDIQSFGTAEDLENKPAGTNNKLRRHPCLEKTPRTESIMTDSYPKHNAGGFKNVPPQGSAELRSQLRSPGSTVLPGPHAIGVPAADHCQPHPVRPPPGFQPLQHLFPQLFPPQQMTLQPALNPLQMPSVPPANQMNVIQEGIPPPIILFLPPGQPAPPFLLPASIMDSYLPGGGPLWPSTPLCRYWVTEIIKVIMRIKNSQQPWIHDESCCC